MTDYEKEQFWQGLARLYDATVNLKAATEALRDVAQAHEQRLDRAEVIQQAILENLKRREEGRT